MNSSCYTVEELHELSFASIGENVRIDKTCKLFGNSNIHIGDNVRIDAFCVISAGEAGIFIGSHIHISVYTSLIGSGKIIINDFSTISARVSIFSSNDDYSGYALTNPCLPSELRNVCNADVIVEKHAIIGAGSIILPDVTIGTGAAIGALSLVKSNVPEFSIFAGTPAKIINKRNMKILELEKHFLNQHLNG